MHIEHKIDYTPDMLMKKFCLGSVLKAAIKRNNRLYCTIPYCTIIYNNIGELLNKIHCQGKNTPKKLGISLW